MLATFLRIGWYLKGQKMLSGDPKVLQHEYLEESFDKMSSIRVILAFFFHYLEIGSR